MNHHFQSPRVVEIGPNGVFRTERPAVGKPSQRTLVEASLLRCPQRDESKPRA